MPRDLKKVVYRRTKFEVFQRPVREDLSVSPNKLRFYLGRGEKGNLNYRVELNNPNYKIE